MLYYPLFYPSWRPSSTDPLLIILLIGIINNVEESQLINTLGGGDNSEPISQLLLLEELLRPILTTLVFALLVLPDGKLTGT